MYQFRSRSFSERAPNTTLLRHTVSFEADPISKLLLSFPETGRGLSIIMSMKLYVGNLSFNTSVQDLEKLFGEVGTVESTNIIEDRETGRSRGFAFIEMSSQEEGQNAISRLNAKEIDGREMIVNEAKPREDRGGSGRSNRSSGYGGGGSRW